MKPISLGLIGAGFHARTVHIPAYDLVDEIRLVAMATSREETAKDAAERYRLPATADYRELLARDDIEAVTVCTPHNTLVEIGRAAVEAGKHVLLETPGLSDIAAARALQEAARKNNRVVQVAYCNRYAPPFDLIKTALDAQAPGRIFSYEYYPWLHHTYNLALYFSGPVDRVVSSVSDAPGSTTILQFKNGDRAVVIGRGLVNSGLKIDTVRISSPTFYASVEGRMRVTIIDNIQPADVDGWGITNTGGRVYESQAFGSRYLKQSGTVAMLQAFAAAIREGSPPRSTLDDAIETKALMDEIARIQENK